MMRKAYNGTPKGVPHDRLQYDIQKLSWAQSPPGNALRRHHVHQIETPQRQKIRPSRFDLSYAFTTPRDLSCLLRQFRPTLIQTIRLFLRLFHLMQRCRQSIRIRRHARLIQ